MHSRVQQVNKISGSDALALGYFQQFNDSDSTTSGLGSADCRILFIVTFLASCIFCEAKRYIHQIF